MNLEKLIKLAEEAGATTGESQVYKCPLFMFDDSGLERFAAAIEAEKDAIILVLEKELKALKNYRDLLSEVLVETYNSETEQSKIIAGQQARIDELMLEFCPNEMTTEQIANWSVHQKTQEIGEQK